MKFVIEGAVMADARDITIALEADTLEQAQEMARAKGIFVSSVERSNSVVILPYTIKGASIRSSELPPQVYVLGEIECDDRFFTFPHFDSNGTGFVYAWRKLSSLQAWMESEQRQYPYYHVNTGNLVMGLLDNSCTRYLAYNHTSKLGEQHGSERFVRECLLDLNNFPAVWPTVKFFMKKAGIADHILGAFAKLAMAHKKLRTDDMLKYIETVFKKPVSELVRTGDFGILWNSCSQSMKESGMDNRIVEIMQKKVKSKGSFAITRAVQAVRGQNIV